MQSIAVYSETGGATKTTTAVSLAVCAALAGADVVLIDLDPRAATTKWTGVRPGEAWQHVGAILADPDPAGWVEDLALKTEWSQVPTLRVVPSARSVTNRERQSEDHSDTRLRLALTGLTADVVVMDLPNRQGGPIVQNALTAATDVVYAAQLSEDGLDGVDGAMANVARFRTHREQLGAPANVADRGIIVGSVRDTVMTLDSRRCLAELQRAHGDLVLQPMIPERVIVREARSAGEYYGFFGRGEIVHDAYARLAEQVIDR